MRSNPQPDRIISAQKIFLRRGTLEASLLTDLLSRWPLIQQLRTGADRLWESRERTFQETRDGESLMQTTAIAHLGGATLDNEENYLIKKLFTGGLGMVCISNQARI